MAECADNLLREHQRRREAGRFDREQVDEARYAMVARGLDQKIRGLRSPRHDLWPDAGIARLDGAVLEAGVVLPDRLIEARGASRIDVVVDAFDPFDVGAKAHLAPEIDRDMDAEPRPLRHRIDQMRERPRAGQGVVVALAEEGG